MTDFNKAAEVALICVDEKDYGQGHRCGKFLVGKCSSASKEGHPRALSIPSSSSSSFTDSALPSAN